MTTRELLEDKWKEFKNQYPFRKPDTTHYGLHTHVKSLTDEELLEQIMEMSIINDRMYDDESI